MNQETIYLGKFKSAEELLKAYQALEAEFTKKCQQLSELTKQSDNAQVIPETPVPIYEREDWKETLDAFFGEFPDSIPYATRIGKILVEDDELATRPEGLLKAYLRTLAPLVKTPEQYMEDEEFVRDHVLTSEKVRDLIIAEYVASLTDGLPPQVITRGGQAVLTPAMKPKNLKEAAKLALKMLG